MEIISHKGQCPCSTLGDASRTDNLIARRAREGVGRGSSCHIDARRGYQAEDLDVGVGWSISKSNGIIVEEFIIRCR